MDEKEGNFIWSIFCCLLCDIFQMRLPDLPQCFALFTPTHVIHWDDIRGADVRIYKCKEHNVRKRAKHASRRDTHGTRNAFSAHSLI